MEHCAECQRRFPVVLVGLLQEISMALAPKLSFGSFDELLLLTREDGASFISQDPA